MKIANYSLIGLGFIILVLSSCKKSTDNSSSDAITDIDGNIYHAITIGTQVWMVENLKTTKYSDGTFIPLVTDNNTWSNLTTPGFCWLNNDANNKNTYGALYNWFVINTGKLAPLGWHIPTEEEWNTLRTYLGGVSIAGGKMKTTGTIEDKTGLWITPNYGATNESGFSAVPGSGRGINGVFFSIGGQSAWWSSLEVNSNSALSWIVTYSSSSFGTGNSLKNLGFSVRCIRD